MIEQDNMLSYMATASVVAVLAGVWILRDLIIASIKLPGNTKEQLRRWSLRIRRMENYVGRHRIA